MTDNGETFNAKPYSLLGYEKAREEGRLVIEKKKTGREHRSFPCTLLPSQVAKTFKATLTKGELADYNRNELMIISKRLMDQLIDNDEENLDLLYKHIRPRLERFYKQQARLRKAGI